MKQELVIGGVYRHFKGHIYRVLAVGRDADNLKRKVIYQNVKDETDIWIRDEEEFLSEIDHQKYKEVKQVFRFQRLDEDNFS